jgi:type I restriction enzyme S subunit
MATAEPTAKTGWFRCSLQEICEGKISDGTHQTPKYYDNGVIFLSSKNVTSGQIDWENIKYIDTKQHLEMHKRLAPRLGDILLAKNGTTGVAAIVDRDVTFDIYVSLALLRPKKEILPHLLLHFINSPIAKKQFNKRLKGVGVPNLHLKEIREVKIDFPCSLAEQERIVGILDEAFEGIAAATAQAEKNLHNARELFQSVLQSTFSQKGDDWEIKILGEMCNLEKTKYTGDQLPYVGMEDIESDTGTFTGNRHPLSVKSSTFAFTPDHMLYGRLRPYLNKVLLPDFEGHCSTEIFPIRPAPGLDRRFLFHWITNSKQVNRINLTCTGARMPRANLKEVLTFTIPVPPIPTQQAIVEKLDALSEETKRLEAIYERKKAALAELKQSLLQKAFAGEL